MNSYLTSVLLAALRADDVRVLVAEVHVLDVPLQAHLVEILEGGRNLKILLPVLNVGPNVSKMCQNMLFLSSTASYVSSEGVLKGCVLPARIHETIDNSFWDITWMVKRVVIITGCAILPKCCL